MTATRHLVVVAVAESDTGDALAERLRTRFTVRTAYDAESLYGSLDETVDVVLFDPDLPGTDPDALADRIDRRDLDCRVGIVTSGRARNVPPVVDEVLDENAPLEELERVIARMAARAAYKKRLERLYDLATRRAALVTRDEEATEQVERIEARIDRLRGEIRDALDRLDDETAFEVALRRLDPETDDVGDAPDDSGGDAPDGSGNARNDDS